MSRRGLLLVNTGTPDSPSEADVRRYLREFLSDPLVIDINPILRWLLLNLVILRTRPRASAAAYRNIWDAEGSPLLLHGRHLVVKAQKTLGSRYAVALAMRYGNPSIASALGCLCDAGVEEVTVLPLFPQGASATTGSIEREVWAIVSRTSRRIEPHFVAPFFDHPHFVSALADRARPMLAEFSPDMVLMSFHGLPERHIRKSDDSPEGHCLSGTACCASMSGMNHDCYRAQCFATARAVAARLKLEPSAYEVCFQSRLGRTKWIEPYTSTTLIELARSGTKRVAVMCPAFVADCLETLEEIGIRGRETFREAGGDELLLIPSLNSSDSWVEAVAAIVRDLDGVQEK